MWVKPFFPSFIFYECLKQTKIYFLVEPLKYNMGQTVLSFDQNLSEALENELALSQEWVEL